NDLMRIVGLGRRKPTPESLKYGGFNRRMIAATIDSIAIVILSPLLESIFTNMYGPIPLDLMALQDQLNAQPTPEAAGKLYIHALVSSGFITRWIYNVFFQFGILALLTALCWVRWSASPGKMIMRLKIVDATTEQKMRMWQIIVRTLGYFISGA